MGEYTGDTEIILEERMGTERKKAEGNREEIGTMYDTEIRRRQERGRHKTGRRLERQ